MINIMYCMGRKNPFIVEVYIDKSQFSFVPFELNEMMINVKFTKDDIGASHIYVPKNANDELFNNYSTFHELNDFEFHFLQEAVNLLFDLVLSYNKMRSRKSSSQVEKFNHGKYSNDVMDGVINKVFDGDFTKAFIKDNRTLEFPSDEPSSKDVKITNPKIKHFDNVNAASVMTKIKNEYIVSQHRVGGHMNFFSSQIFDPYQASTSMSISSDKLISIQANDSYIEPVSIEKFKSRIDASKFPRSPSRPSTTVKMVNVTSLEDAMIANSTKCNDTSDASGECNIRSAIEYCKVLSLLLPLSPVSCIIHLPRYARITQRYGAIELSPTSGGYCDVVIQGGNSVISASSSHNDRFIIVNGPHSIQFHNLTFQNFGTDALLGGVMYYSEASFASIEHVVFDSNKAKRGGAIYL